MKNELKKNLTYNKTMLTLSILCIVFGLSTLLITEIAVPITAAFLSAVFLFEKEGKRRFSYAVSIALVIINGLMFFIPNHPSTFFSLMVIPFALIMYRAYLKGTEKAEAAFAMTAVGALVIVLTLIAAPMIAYAKFDFDVVVAFYKELYALLREELVLAINETLASIPAQNSPLMIDISKIDALLKQQINMLISYVIIFAFLLVGAAFKCFSLIVSRCIDNVKEIFLWRFKTSNVFAYFYFILAIATFFITSADSVFSITVLNLYNVLMLVYCYVGFNVAVAYLSKGRRPVLAFIIVLLAIAFFFIYAIELLAAIGAFFTIRANNRTITKE